MSQHILQEMCRAQLELSGVHEGEFVAVLSQGQERLDYADAFLAAVNDSPCHLDIPMRGCSLFLDDEPILIDGKMQVKEMMPAEQR